MVSSELRIWNSSRILAHIHVYTCKLYIMHRYVVAACILEDTDKNSAKTESNIHVAACYILVCMKRHRDKRWMQSHNHCTWSAFFGSICSEYVLVPLSEAGSFVERCMVAVGTKPSHAKDLATLLVSADYRGHFSHGMNRLGKLLACFHELHMYTCI